jgi:DNA-binding NarL/FixJ family response regulator
MADKRQCISVLIADSTPMATELLAGAVERDPRFQIIRSIAGDAQLMQIAAELRPAVAVISAGLSDDSSNGCEIARELQLASPSTKAILLMDHLHREVVVEAFRAGARGVFCRAGSIEDLCKCIDRVSRGQIWAGCNEIKYALDALVQATPPKLAPLGTTLLSQREKEVVRYVAEGLSNREIAGRLKLSEHTIKNYLFRIFDKLGVSNRAELVFLAFSSPAELVNPDVQNSVQIPEEDGAAFAWCSKAADKFTTAQFMLGQMYRDGRGTEKDPIAAYMWFTIAEATSRRRLQACLKSGERLVPELDAVELAEAKRRASEWLKLNSSELASSKPVLERERIPTNSKPASDKPVLKRKRISPHAA